MILKIYLFMIIFLVMSASRADMYPMIIGGAEVAPSDPIAKSTVFIEGQLIRSSFYCTGSIIATDLILTAGHCLGGAGNARLTVYFRTRFDGPGERIAVVDQIRKMDTIPQDVSSWEDIAILRLATAIPPGYQAAHFLDDSSLLQVGQTVVLAGYGRTAPEPSSSGQQQGLGVLRTVEQNILQTQYNANEFLVDLSGGKGSCQGDSGGPAFIRRGSDLLLAGAVSDMTEKDRLLPDLPRQQKRYSCSVDMVYTNILAQMSWIQSAILELRKTK